MRILSILPIKSSFFLSLAFGALSSPLQASEIDIGSRLELFVDDFLIEQMIGDLNLKLHSPRQTKDIFVFDKPWEGQTAAYVSILADGDLYRMYYRGGLGEPGYPDACICYAESKDGLRWTKPELNIVEYRGTRKNNIVWMGVGSHSGFGVFRDTNPDCNPAHQYKALASDGYNQPVFAFGSPDAIHWNPIDEKPVITEHRGAAAAHDSQFAAWWDETCKCYVLFNRAWYRPVDGKVRSIATRTSNDFMSWTPLKLLDFGDTQFEHLYTNAAQRYFRAPHIIMTFPKRFMPNRKLIAEAPYNGISDAVFATSRDGVHFDRRFMEGFIRPGRNSLNWYSRSNMVATGLLPTADDEISLYVSQAYNHPTAHLRRHVIRTDGFVSVHASYQGGELLTKPLHFSGNHLVINHATSAAGSIRVEITDSSGTPLPGHSAKDCRDIYGDDINHVVTWKSGPDISDLAGKPIRLRFVMRDADLYSIQTVSSGGASSSPTAKP